MKIECHGCMTFSISKAISFYLIDYNFYKISHFESLQIVNVLSIFSNHRSAMKDKKKKKNREIKNETRDPNFFYRSRPKERSLRSRRKITYASLLLTRTNVT